MFQTERKEPEQNNIHLRDSLQIIAENLFYLHMVLSALYTIMLLILEPRLKSGPLTLTVVIIYGLMLFWLLLFNLFFKVFL